ncbi:MAG: iron-sulfur cluster-binding protein [Lentimicrobiaceae bacterium]|nr:iron-sulfur cluster-binding protein [Lentimicrobiaceae bacterium]
MSEIRNHFIKESREKAFNLEHRRRIQHNMSRYDQAVLEGKQQYSDLEAARERAAFIKHKVLDDLDKYLIDFESNLEKRGGRVIWAQNGRDAVKEILRILKKHEVKLVVKSKSMISEELELNDALQKQKIEAIETDLGEYIVQLAGEDPYHIVTPAMHKSKEDVSELFEKKFGTPANSQPEAIAAFVREKLREEFMRAGAVITGANFLIADTGAIALTENEGNAMMGLAFPSVHIAIAGIEKVLPSLRDLSLFWPLLATHGTGQYVSVYNSIVTGPRQQGEKDGPDEMYVILLDNNRTDILAMKEQRKALACIRCGACLNACPVYRNIGGHTYNTTYTGPIGAVIAPHLEGMRDYNHLSFASTLCGKCTEVCPVRINLHELLLFNRRDAVKNGYTLASERFVMRGWKRVMMKRWMMDTGSKGFRSLLLNRFFGKGWGPRRTLPELQPKSFHQIWEETRGLKKS